MMQATDQGVIDGVMYQCAIEGAIKDVSDGALSHRRDDVWCEGLIREP